MKFLYEKLSDTVARLKSSIYTHRTEVSGLLYKKCGYLDLNCVTASDGFREFAKDERIVVDRDEHFLIYKKLTIPRDNTYLFAETGKNSAWDEKNPQFIVYANGRMLHQLDTNHNFIRFDKAGEYELYFYGYVGYTAMSGGKFDFRLYLAEKNECVEKLTYDMEVPLMICGYLGEDTKDYIDIMSSLNKAADMIDFRDTGSDYFADSVSRAIDYMENVFYKDETEERGASVVCIGHTHIDVAWLWTVRQSREKMVRSMSMVVNLMKQYPEYRFMTSQAALLSFVKEDAPGLYSEIKALAREGRFEVEGAMWVEADCNLPDGESLIRQIIYGKKFFKQEFDKDCEILWLPDVFGYSAAMPQILRKCGINTFVTSKLGWNEYNRIPNDTFMWQGIDGTEIFTYFLTCQEKKRGSKPKTETGYAAVANPQTVAGTYDRYQNKELTDEILMTFGYADGGGGPNEQMLEYLRRTARGIKGCPRTRIDTAGSFFDSLKQKTENNPALKKWVGELYLEFHRGTYTSVAKNKKNNRKCEYLLHNAELLGSMQNVLLKLPYAKDKLNELWKILLINQFHDIIPGSSIKEVYEVSDREYARLKEDAGNLITKGIDSLCRNICTDGGIIVFNPHGFEYSGDVKLDGKVYLVEGVPAFGYRVFAENELICGNEVKIGVQSIENTLIRVEFNEKMHITSIYDKTAHREIVAQNAEANVIEVYEDMPRIYEAWEVRPYFADKKWIWDDVSEVKQIDPGAAKGFAVKRRFLDSELEQRILLYPHSTRIDFETKINWKQQKLLVKAAFPTDILSGEATCDIQFGNVKRPTHRNTSWDEARFEVCAHKYVDLSESNYGVSLLNDCKYGHDFVGGTLRLTLVKSATDPCADADTGEHSFVYSLYPHSGDFRQARTEEEAFRLNQRPAAAKIGKNNGLLPRKYSFAHIQEGNAVLQCVKQSEDGRGLIFRLYENFGGRSNIRLKFGFDVHRVTETDITENELREVKVCENQIECIIKPYEIITLKVYSKEE